MDFMDFLDSYQSDAATFLLILFIYTIAASVFLPIPVEIAIWSQAVPFPVTAVVLGFGKAVGSVIVFMIGVRLEEKIRSWTRWGWFNWLVEKSHAFVSRFGYYALYALMSIPFMPDTIPLYVFSLLNKEGEVFSKRGFAIVNFFAGVTRATFIWTLVKYMEIGLV